MEGGFAVPILRVEREGVSERPPFVQSLDFPNRMAHNATDAMDGAQTIVFEGRFWRAYSQRV